jgi:hypothetical protein
MSETYLDLRFDGESLATTYFDPKSCTLKKSGTTSDLVWRNLFALAYSLVELYNPDTNEKVAKGILIVSNQTVKLSNVEMY